MVVAKHGLLRLGARIPVTIVVPRPIEIFASVHEWSLIGFTKWSIRQWTGVGEAWLSIGIVIEVWYRVPPMGISQVGVVATTAAPDVYSVRPVTRKSMMIFWVAVFVSLVSVHGVCGQ
jgi:hypothetical protein